MAGPRYCNEQPRGVVGHTDCAVTDRQNCNHESTSQRTTSPDNDNENQLRPKTDAQLSPFNLFNCYLLALCLSVDIAGAQTKIAFLAGVENYEKDGFRQTELCRGRCVGFEGDSTDRYGSNVSHCR